MIYRSLPVAALLLGLASGPGFAQTRPAPDAAAARTLEQNRKVSVGLPPASPPPAAEATAPPPRRLALAARR